MNMVSGTVVYLLIWWVVLLATLPWGVVPETNPQVGNAPGAPVKPLLRLKFLVTTAIATVIWLLIYLLIKAQVIDFYALSEQMMREDGL